MGDELPSCQDLQLGLLRELFAASRCATKPPSLGGAVVAHARGGPGAAPGPPGGSFGDLPQQRWGPRSPDDATTDRGGSPGADLGPHRPGAAHEGCDARDRDLDRAWHVGFSGPRPARGGWGHRSHQPELENKTPRVALGGARGRRVVGGCPRRASLGA